MSTYKKEDFSIGDQVKIIEMDWIGNIGSVIYTNDPRNLILVELPLDCGWNSTEWAAQQLKQEIRDLLKKDKGYWWVWPQNLELIPSSVKNASNTSDSVVNNHTCVLCKNDRCNKNEKSCWRCGHPI